MQQSPDAFGWRTPAQPSQQSDWLDPTRGQSLQSQDHYSARSSGSNVKPTKERPCDSCRRRKSRCHKEEGQQKCVLCKLHHQECTYLHEPVARNKKRKSSSQLGEGSFRKSKSSRSNIGTDVDEYDHYEGETILRKTLGLMKKKHSNFVGLTEPFSFPRYSMATGTVQKDVQAGQVTVRCVDRDTIFTINEDQGTFGYDSELNRIDAIERAIEPYGPELVTLYFRIVHPSFPILHKGAFFEKYARSYREFCPALLASVYLLASQYWNFSSVLSETTKPNLTLLWRFALESFDITIFRPKLSSVQAGLLLAQYESSDGGIVSSGARGRVTAHLISTAHKLGLHLDPTDWDIPSWEIGLRRRLAWAVYMQDKWVSLIEGRPTLISNLNWTVSACIEHDFPEAQEDDEEGSSEVQKGRTIFMEMISLTIILSDILDSIFSLRANNDIGKNSDPLGYLLQKVRPLQTRLREWFGSLPQTLRMANRMAMKLSSVGYLRLAYLTVEVSLHRRIICQTTTGEYDPKLLQVCRSAARERFLYALEFVDSLKPQHLTSFWYFCSSACLSLAISFGNLLVGSSTNEEEREFFLGKLKEFRWILRVSGESGAKFMKPALSAMLVNPDELHRVEPTKSDMSDSPAVSGASQPSSLNFSPQICGESWGIATTPSWQSTPSAGVYLPLAVPQHLQQQQQQQQYVGSYPWVEPDFEGNHSGQYMREMPQ